MTPERWRQIEKLYQAGRERNGAERQAFLEQACGKDEELRREVESLLRQQEQARSFLESPALDVAAEELAQETPSLIGKHIGSYRVLSLLGKGGMGEVYLAQDEKLDRKVALKFLPPELQRDETARRRFLREAKSAAALDHPFICHIHEIGETEGAAFIAMEYVPGERLDQRLAKGPLPLKEALERAVEIAEALEAAHQQHIVHRDLKPSNILLTPKGHAKVMDFGLAKRLPSEDEEDKRPTAALSQTGITLGTLPYMSPEQLRGEAVDARSDLFSFGVVLYEMFTGVHPFMEAGTAQTPAAILCQEAAPLEHHLNDVPGLLQHTVGKMLAKNRNERHQSVQEVRTELEEVRESSLRRAGARVRKGWGPGSRVRRSFWLAVGAAVLIAAGAFAVFLQWIREPAPGQKAPRALAAVPFTSYPGVEGLPNFSPQGDRIAFNWRRPDTNPDIYVKPIGPGDPLRLTTDAQPDSWPQWSPDGQEIAFVRWFLPGKVEIRTVPAFPGPERKVTEIDVKRRYDSGLTGLSWSPVDRQRLAVSFRPPGEEEARVFLLGLDTGEMKQLTFPPEGSYGDYWVQFSPDGRKIAFLRRTGFWNSDLYLQSLDKSEAERLTFERIAPLRGGTVPAFGIAWMPGGDAIVFSAEGGLWQVKVSDRELTRLTGHGENLLKVTPTVSAQGDRLAYVEATPGGGNIWRIPNPRVNHSQEAPRRLISSTRNDEGASLSPDGRRIVFVSDRTGRPKLYVCNRDGSQVRQLIQSDAKAIEAGPAAWSPNSRHVAFLGHPGEGADIYVVGAEGGRPRQVTKHPAEDTVPTWSRDGKWIYFASNRSGRFQTWKVRFEGGDPVQVTRGGGYRAHESSDGRLYYTKGNPGEIWRVPVEGGEETRVLPGSRYWWEWNLVSEGIYIDESEPKGEAYEWRVDFLNFRSGETRRILAVEVPANKGGFQVSPDEQWFFLTVNEPLPKHRTVDIMLVENFR